MNMTQFLDIVKNINIIILCIASTVFVTFLACAICVRTFICLKDSFKKKENEVSTKTGSEIPQYINGQCLKDQLESMSVSLLRPQYLAIIAGRKMAMEFNAVPLIAIFFTYCGAGIIAVISGDITPTLDNFNFLFLMPSLMLFYMYFESWEKSKEFEALYEHIRNEQEPCDFSLNTKKKYNVSLFRKIKDFTTESLQNLIVILTVVSMLLSYALVASYDYYKEKHGLSSSTVQEEHYGYIPYSFFFDSRIPFIYSGLYNMEHLDNTSSSDGE